MTTLTFPVTKSARPASSVSASYSARCSFLPQNMAFLYYLTGWRQIIIDPETCELVQKIRSLNPDGEYLFEKNGKRLHSSAWSYKLPRVCEKLHIGKPSEKSLYSLGKSMHKGRKNYASSLLHSGVDPKLVQEQMGHRDLKTTINYYDRDVEELEEMRKALLPVLEKL